MSLGWLLLSVLLLVLFLVLNAFFVATEFALVASRQSRISELAGDGNAAAKTAQQLQLHIGTSVSGTQLGITLCSLALGWVGENTFHVLVDSLLAQLPHLSWISLPHGFGILIAFMMLSAMHVVLGEQVPKFVALRMPERLVLLVAPLFRLYCRLAWPLIWLMSRSAELILKLWGIPKPGDDDKFVHSPEELEMLFEASRKAGELGDRETDLLKNVLDLRDVIVAEVLLPVKKMDAISVDLSLKELIAIISKTKHTKLPVYKRTVDDIVGILNTRDLFDWWSGALASASTDGDLWKKRVASFKIQNFMRPAYTVQKTMKASTLLDDLRKRKTKIAIVKDSNGRTAGLVTMEDLLEELVGEIYDEFDKLELPPKPSEQKPSEQKPSEQKPPSDTDPANS